MVYVVGYSCYKISRQDYEAQRFEETAEEYRRFAVKAGRINALLNPAIFIAVRSAERVYLLVGERVYMRIEICS